MPRFFYSNGFGFDAEDMSDACDVANDIEKAIKRVCKDRNLEVSAGGEVYEDSGPTNQPSGGDAE